MTKHHSQQGMVMFTCADAGPFVFRVGKVDVYAGSAKAADDNWDFDIMLRFYDWKRHSMPIGVSLNEQAQLQAPVDKLTRITTPMIIDVHWPDGLKPMLDLQWWEDLVEWLQSFKEDTRMMIHCEGGAGRTGTALAIIERLAFGGETDPVEMVRQIYCDEAVESPAQINYINRILGPGTTDALPSLSRLYTLTKGEPYGTSK